MGTPMAPTYASLFMCEYESHYFSGIATSLEGQIWKHIGPMLEKYYFRYIDDGIMIWPWGEELAYEFLQHFQQGSSSISLTHEIAYVGQRLPFLDLYVSLVPVSDGSLRVFVEPYDKPMNLHIYANPETYYPNKYIFNWIGGEHIRLIRNSGNPEVYFKAIKEFRDYLLRRNYPRDEIQVQ